MEGLTLDLESISPKVAGLWEIPPTLFKLGKHGRQETDSELCDSQAAHRNGALLLSCKRNKMVLFAETWTDLEAVIQSEVSQKEKQLLYVNASVRNLQRFGTDELICKAEIETQT